MFKEYCYNGGFSMIQLNHYSKIEGLLIDDGWLVLLIDDYVTSTICVIGAGWGF